MFRTLLFLPTRLCARTMSPCPRSIWTVAALVCLLASPLTACAQNHDQNPRVFPPHSKPYGKTYGEWCAEWHKWVLGLPVAINPLLDSTGENGHVGQSGPVWFLAREDGFTGSHGFPIAFVERTCTVPVGKALYIPLANDTWAAPESLAFLDAIAFMVGAPPEDRLRAILNYVLDHAHDLALTIDGRPVQNLAAYRMQSPLFAYDFPADSLIVALGIAPGAHSPAVAGGYGVIIPPLPPGTHEIHGHIEFTYVDDPVFGATFHYIADFLYHLTVR